MHLRTEMAASLPPERLAVLGVVSAAALGAVNLFSLGMLEPVLTGAAAGLLCLIALTAAQALLARRRGRLAPGIRAMLQGAAEASVVTDARGRCLGANLSAGELGGWAEGEDFARGIGRLAVQPEALFARLAACAAADGAASDTLGLAEPRLRLQVRKLGRDRLLWTFDRAVRDPEFAVVSLTADGLSFNPAARGLFGAAAPTSLAQIVLDLPVRQGGLHRIRTAAGEAEARLVELGGGQEIGVLPVEAAQPLGAGFLAGPGLLSALPVPMLKIAEDGALLEANAEARTILSLKDGTLPPLFELVEGMGRPISGWLAEAASARGLLKPEIVRAVMPGQELFLQITLGRAVEEGRIVLVGILNDATELKTLEAQFVQSQKMQAIGQLAGGIAHDFNNLLTAISGHCDLLLLRHDTGDPEYADLIQISQNANRAASLVGQLLAFSRKQNLKPQALDLRDTMADLVHLLNRLIGERVTLEVTHAPGPQIIRADRRQLEQVIVNLVVNARDAMPQGGTISITTRSEFLADEMERDRARLTPGDYVAIEVRDEGMGIPQEGLTKIFEPFYTTKRTGEGTGLGLSTAYGIVKQTGGYIFVDSTVGEGTLFTLYFPASHAMEEEPAAPAPTKRVLSVKRADGVILLVEDEAPVRAFASRALRLRGYTVIEAEDAEAALRLLDDEALSVDLFVTDVVMPGMDGPTWVREALVKRPDTRVVFMSGYAEEGRAEKQARIPNSVFLPKPFSLQQLTALVQEQLA
jgi:two-component system cell cycle sensor histidine kinase/response regulator CckA